MTTEDKICLSRCLDRGATHVCHEDEGHAGDHVCKSCGERWARLIEPPSLVDAVHTVDVAAAESRGRAAGWREAIEALRDELGYNAWAIRRKHVDAWQPTAVSDTHREILSCFLESLAPKETT